MWNFRDKWWELPAVNGNRQKAEAFAKRYGFKFNEPVRGKTNFDRPLPDMPEMNLTDEQVGPIPKAYPIPIPKAGHCLFIDAETGDHWWSAGAGENSSSDSGRYHFSTIPMLGDLPKFAKSKLAKEWAMWTNKKAGHPQWFEQGDMAPIRKRSKPIRTRERRNGPGVYCELWDLKKYFVSRIDVEKGPKTDIEGREILSIHQPFLSL